MQTTETRNHEGTIWGRLIGSGSGTLSAAAARSILAIEFPAEDKARMHELSTKANQGLLTPEEQDEIESYSRVGSILGIMKSKARVALKKASKSNGKGR
jgi:hypothetical protein